VATAPATNVAVPAPTRLAPEVSGHFAYSALRKLSDIPHMAASHAQSPVHEPSLAIAPHVAICAVTATDWASDFVNQLSACVDSSVNSQSLPECVHKLFALHVVASEIPLHVNFAAQKSQNESPGEARATFAQPAKTANASVQIDTVARLPRVCIVFFFFVVVVAGSLPRARRSVAETGRGDRPYRA